MIVVNVNAGLANQMFHYAFGRGLVAKGLDVCYDQSNFKPSLKHEAICLQDAFPGIELRQMPAGHFRWVVTEYNENSRYVKKLACWLRKLSNYVGYETYILESSYGYTEGMERKATGNCIYRGFWQSEKYFKHCEADIRKQFTFSPFDEPQNIETAHQMRMENSVAIHFRKGKDYLQDTNLGELCTVDYYLSAIQYIREHVEHPVFYVFTDNPRWVDENLPGLDAIRVNWNELSGKRCYRDMQLMACAKHNIIANSTYSWWGAWLNPNPEKIVVAPKQFFHPSRFFSSSDIVCQDWIAL